MLTFNNVSPAQLAGLEKQLADSRQATMTFAPPGATTNSGTIVGHGVTATFAYVNQTLTIRVTQHPWYMPLSAVESSIQDNVQKALGVAA